MTADEISVMVTRFKSMPIEEQSALLTRAYGNAQSIIEDVVVKMNAMTEMTEYLQTMQRVHGYPLSSELAEAFRKFTTASVAMADAWVKNNAAMARSIQLHNVATKQHPHF